MEARIGNHVNLKARIQPTGTAVGVAYALQFLQADRELLAHQQAPESLLVAGHGRHLGAASTWQ